MLDALRTATATAHRRLEARLALLHPELTEDRYRRILAALLGHHAPFEERLVRARAWEVVGLEAAGGPRAHHLRSDLVALGLSAAEVDALPVCNDLPDPAESPSRALGCLYVHEGATLGGQVILRHLRACLGLDESRGARFFGGHGEATAARWKRTLEAIAAFGARPDASAEAAADGALETFTTLERWLESREALA